MTIFTQFKKFRTAEQSPLVVIHETIITRKLLDEF